MENYLKENKVNWMQWKLRMPLVLFLLGLMAGIYQSFPKLFLIPNSYLISSIQYLGGIALLIWLFEKIGLNDKKVHFSVGILLIAAGFLIDFIFVGYR
ncbi:hypothetical protein [Paenisporosarcina antarctica]|uniref:Uncharacterized protein n=1 Tax=Paenisporosarcina antarctica TaxID=417367 RepID=A0A4P6ZVK5_9BACL|nr:hypothetical protein [Paenisporosarcina antarctica]QBP40174.1 hypothetical protein E2636_02970 [Paenisporosarcina antarctica]